MEHIPDTSGMNRLAVYGYYSLCYVSYAVCLKILYVQNDTMWRTVEDSNNLTNYIL